MKIKRLLCYLFLSVSCATTAWAQREITAGDAAKHIGQLVKLNCQTYKTADDGKTLSIYLQSLTLRLTGDSRKNILSEMLFRRRLNRQIKSPLDTSLTATGKIILDNGRLRMIVSNASSVYLGADLKVQQP